MAIYLKNKRYFKMATKNVIFLAAIVFGITNISADSMATDLPAKYVQQMNYSTLRGNRDTQST